MENTRKLWPCSDEALVERDSARARAMVENAIQHFRQNQQGNRPLAAELAFGKEGLETVRVDGVDFTPPEDFRLNLGGGKSIRFTGTVDRLDKGPDGDLEILDYKTGSAYYFLRGRGHKLQYYLYAQAVQQFSPQLFGEGKNVSHATYLLLSPEGVRVVDNTQLDQDSHAKLSALLELLSTKEGIYMTQPTWENGCFVEDDSEERNKRLKKCTNYCPYAEICQEVNP